MQIYDIYFNYIFYLLKKQPSLIIIDEEKDGRVINKKNLTFAQ